MGHHLKVTIWPFRVLRKIGFSASRITRLERLRRRHEALGHALIVVSWPDGVWCVLILHTERFGAVALDEPEKLYAYHEARQMVSESIVPILHLRHEIHA
ncbi:hypothetical protein AQS70_07145 [Pseudomonas endophytica]|uniref:Uncharacterized protein n=1 Tax=Pseudomonas endophytica TaxID=1563157 RepID=A0A0Q0X3Y4_9PSED|nr:hypothetical protein [Pseudomonas endophytica]KQB54551.1 hypothetical protein AQS70_07145 [Pseudomonas endophytica]